MGFGAALAPGCSSRVVIDVSPWLRRALYPLLVASQTIPIITLAPLLVLWFGFGLVSKSIVVLLVCFFPIAVAFADGLRGADPELSSSSARSARARLRIFWSVRLPGALPALFSGIRIAITYSVIGAIFSEYVGAEAGPGVLHAAQAALIRHRRRARGDCRHRAAEHRALRAHRAGRAAGAALVLRPGTRGERPVAGAFAVRDRSSRSTMSSKVSRLPETLAVAWRRAPALLIVCIGIVSIHRLARAAALARRVASSSSTAASNGPVAKVTLALDWTPNTNHTGIYVAMAKGYYAAWHRPDAQPYSSSVYPEQLVATGQAEFGISFPERSRTFRAQGEPHGLDRRGHPAQHSALVSLKSSGLDTVASLAGKRYAGFGAPYEQPVIAADARVWGAANATFRTSRPQLDPVAALKSGQFDFAWVYQGWEVIQAQREGVQRQRLPAGGLLHARLFLAGDRHQCQRSSSSIPT